MAAITPTTWSPRIHLTPLSMGGAPPRATIVSVAHPFKWSSLPTELRLAILAQLPIEDVKACSLVSREAHELCIGVLFRVCRGNAASPFLRH